MKQFNPISIIVDFTKEDGSDSLQEAIEAIYRQVKQELLALVDNEITRIKAIPHLLTSSKNRIN